MVGAEADDEIADSHRPVQMCQQRADRGVEAHEHILHLVAGRTEIMAHQVQCGEADAQKVGA